MKDVLKVESPNKRFWDGDSETDGDSEDPGSSQNQQQSSKDLRASLV